jgi:hypothetical protein
MLTKYTRIAALLFVPVGAFAGMEALSEARAQERSIEIYAGGKPVEVSRQRTHEVQQAPEPERSREYATFPTSRTRAPIDYRLPEGTAEAAVELVEAAADAFMRGLMPLDHYLEQMRVVYSLELRLAMEQNDRQAARMAAQRHIDRLAGTVEVLEAFNEPAAEGWVADTLLAQAALADAEGELANLQGNRGAAQAARERFESLAWDHLQARQIDDVELGLASLPTLANAVAMVAATGEEGAAEFGAFREQILLTTEVWNAVGAEIGREDLVQQAELEAATEGIQWALMNEDAPGFAAAVQQAEQTAREMLSTRMEFYEFGTASLADLTQTWMLRSRVHQLAAEVDGGLTEQMDRQRREDLSSLLEIADSIEDLRGRHAADVQFVRLLHLAESAEPIEQPESIEGEEAR